MKCVLCNSSAHLVSKSGNLPTSTRNYTITVSSLINIQSQPAEALVQSPCNGARSQFRRMKVWTPRVALYYRSLFVGCGCFLQLAQFDLYSVFFSVRSLLWGEAPTPNAHRGSSRDASSNPNLLAQTRASHATNGPTGDQTTDVLPLG